MAINFEKYPLKTRLKSMLLVDFRRLFTSPLFYIMVGISLVVPILILVMTTMMDGTITVDPQTGNETIFEGFTSVWQIIGTANNATTMGMDVTSMCNINLMYFLIAVFVCVFVSDDFRSGYAKNLFTVRTKKDDYIISKTVVCFTVGAVMLCVFFVGAMVGGAITGLSFALENATSANVVFCMLSKMFLVGIFVAIYLFASLIAKQKLWLGLLLSLGIGMLFFTITIIMTPLNCGILNLVLCAVGSALFCTGIGFASYAILNKLDIV